MGACVLIWGGGLGLAKYGIGSIYDSGGCGISAKSGI